MVPQDIDAANYIDTLERERDGLFELCDINLDIARTWEKDVMRLRKAIEDALAQAHLDGTDASQMCDMLSEALK